MTHGPRTPRLSVIRQLCRRRHLSVGRPRAHPVSSRSAHGRPPFRRTSEGLVDDPTPPRPPQGIGRGIGAGLLAGRGMKPVAAACAQYGRACGSGDECCSENCLEGKCASRFGGRCVDLLTSEAHCSACDTPCPDDRTCRYGHCTCAPYGGTCREDHNGCCSGNCVEGKCDCRPIHTRCGKRCVDLRWDINNCGECGRACPQSRDLGLTRVCRAGTCVCTPGTADCGGNGICVDLNNDSDNCGTCGRACTDGAVCRQGACV
jgi:hypothetical protein